MQGEHTDSIATYSPEPDIGRIIDQFQKAGQQGDFFYRQNLSENTRLAIWDGQSDDGKKWSKNMAEGKRAFPWEGANDSRVYQADGVINEQVTIKTNAFWRAELRVSPIQPNEDAEKSSMATTYLDWLVNTKLRCKLEDEVELAAQYEASNGWYGISVTWDREIRYKARTFRMDELVSNAQQMSQQDPSQLTPSGQRMVDAIISLPQLIISEDTEKEAVDLVKELYLPFIQNNLPPQLSPDEVKPLTAKSAKRIVRELREDGSTDIPVPYLCKDEPCIKTLKPWRDIVLPAETASPEDASYQFMVSYMNETDIRSKVLSDGWNQAWVEEAIKAKGRRTTWIETNRFPQSLQWGYTNDENELVEVVCAYMHQIDEEGVTGIYYTIFSPHISGSETAPTGNLYAKHALLGYPHSQYPHSIGCRERIDRSVLTSRGIPELLLTSQREEKVQRDAIADLTSIAVLPPVNVYKGTLGKAYTFGPGAQNEVTQGREPQYMNIPTAGAPISIDYIRLIREGVDNYFGRFTEAVHPGHSQLMMERSVRRFLQTWSNALKQAYALSLKFAPEQVERITGTKPDAEASFDANEYDIVFHFDVAQLHPDLFVQKMDAYSKLLAEDSSGVLDRGKLTVIKARIIDPNIAKEIVMDQAGASEQLFRQIQNDLVAMFAGNQAVMSDASNDPTAPTKMQYFMQILTANPKYMAALDPKVLEEIAQDSGQQMPQQQQGMPQGEPDPIFTFHVSNYYKNLSMGVKQQKNKQIGRTGVA